MNLLIYIFFLHWVGDFVLQSRWMGNNKSKNWFALAFHVAVYENVLFFGLIAYPGALKFAVINMIIHFFIDAITSRASGFFFKKNNIYAFFTVIGFDQFLHAATLMLTFHYLL